MSGLTVPVHVTADRWLTRTRLSVPAALGVYVFALFVLPGNRVIAAMGAVGTPAVIVGLSLALGWTWGHLNHPLAPWPPCHVGRVGILTHLAFFVLAYGIAFVRPLTELEASGANRALIQAVAYVAVALVAADGLSRVDDVDRLLVAILWGAAFMATVGVVQFFTGFDPARYLRVPGLTANYQSVGVGGRSVFNRPFGTALHPIEFGVVCASVLPLGFHAVMYAPNPVRRRRAGIALALVTLGIPISISRSAILSLAVGIVAMVGVWGWRRRANVAVGGLVATVLVWGAIPGLLGTIRGLFVGLDTDPSITARTDRVPRIIELFSQRPLLGRGLGTYSVDDYFLVDNEWYVSAIELGAIGVTVLALFILITALAARRAGRLVGDARGRHLGYAIAASILALFASIGTFDAFFYRIFSGMLFLLIGAAWALLRISRTRSDHS